MVYPLCVCADVDDIVDDDGRAIIIVYVPAECIL